MANTRFKGANASERLTLSTLSDSDMFQTRHLPGTVNDADKGVSKALLQALPVAICATAAATAAKVGTLAPESCPDFTLVNGRVIHVYFSAANTASVPTINVAGTGAIPITYTNGDYVGAWAAGTTMDLMYISITVDNTAIERWVVVSSLPVDEVALNNMNSVTSNAVAECMSYKMIERKTGAIAPDGRPIYKNTYMISNPQSSNVPSGITNLHTVYDLQWVLKTQTDDYFHGWWPYGDGFTVFLANTMDFNFLSRSSIKQLVINIEFTKTTD